jgi:hypothetical protein
MKSGNLPLSTAEGDEDSLAEEVGDGLVAGTAAGQAGVDEFVVGETAPSEGTYETVAFGASVADLGPA